MDLQREMEIGWSHSYEVAELFAAIAQSQGEMDNPKKGNTNPHFRSKYADLEAFREVVKGPLSKHGLGLLQLPIMNGDRAGCVTILTHKSGQWISGQLLLPVSKQDAQGAGSAITYARRYMVGGITNTVGEDDDDGNAAVKPPVASVDETKRVVPTLEEYVASLKAAKTKERWTELRKELVALKPLMHKTDYEARVSMYNVEWDKQPVT